MSVFQAWQEQFSEGERASQSAVHAWCSVRPDAHEWAFWLDAMAGPHDYWGRHVMEGLGHEKQAWVEFLRGAAESSNYKNNPMPLLDYIRANSIDSGRALTPLPLVCVEALAATAAEVAPRWKQQLLCREPSYWFGPAQDADPALTAPLHELAAQLFCSSQLPTRRLPALAWSPSMLYDDYGVAPDTVKHLQAPIQHALEYAVYVHQKQSGVDALAHAEVHHYFEKYGLDLGTFETLLDLSSNSPTLDNYVHLIKAMLAQPSEQYHVELNDETPQP